MVRLLVSELIRFGTWIYLQYYLLFEWLGYPVFPALVTNDYWMLLRITAETFALALLFAIPAFWIATAAKWLFWTLIHLILWPARSGHINGGGSEDAC